ncbi:MAG: HAMP domain-containing histidine kinase [Gammaproteobacteria bacterium]
MKFPSMKLHSYTARLALLYALVFSASTLILFYFFYLFTASYMIQQAEKTIQAEIRGLAERYERRGLAGLVALISARVSRQQAQTSGNAIYLLATRAFRPLAGNLDRWPKNAAAADGWIEFDLVTNRESGETHLVRAKIFRLQLGRYGLLVGLDIHQLTEAKRRIVHALAWGLAIMLLLAFPGGLILGRRSARKIERINQTARSIISGDLSRRVPLGGHNDDFDQVAQNLNRMLDRIQLLMEDIRRVSDGIAHDLRTPLARLRQRLEEARRREAPNSDSAHSLEGAIAEADSLLSTFNALLRIARIEARQMKPGGGTIDFRALIEDAAEFYEPLLEEKQQRIDTDIEAGIVAGGDRDLMFQALANIIENSAKYAPRRGLISISLRRHGDAAIIAIADNGPGIPEAELENVFRRFYRLDQSRSSSGNGLGLSLAAAVVAMHGGRIELQCNHPGLRALITLPLTAQAAQPGART